MWRQYMTEIIMNPPEYLCGGHCFEKNVSLFWLIGQLWIWHLVLSNNRFTVQCSSVSSQADRVILWLVLVKATLVQWVRVKQSALLCLSCFGSRWTLKRERTRWLMPPIHTTSVITCSKSLSSPCRSLSSQWHFTAFPFLSESLDVLFYPNVKKWFNSKYN